MAISQRRKNDNPTQIADDLRAGGGLVLYRNSLPVAALSYREGTAKLGTAPLGVTHLLRSRLHYALLDTPSTSGKSSPKCVRSAFRRTVFAAVQSVLPESSACCRVRPHILHRVCRRTAADPHAKGRGLSTQPTSVTLGTHHKPR